MAITLTQVLNRQNQVFLYGHRVCDFVLRGDLGMGLDPAGPLVFAWICAFAAADGRVRELKPPLLMSVPGEGEVLQEASALERVVAWEASSAQEVSADRRWRVRRGDDVVVASLRQVALEHLLSVD